MSSSASTPWLESASSSPPPPSSFAAAFAVNATTVAVGINAAANSSGGGGGASSPYEMGAKFNPSMAIIIVVLLSTFFFMGFLSIYVKKCVTTEGDMEHLHIPWTLDHRGGGVSSSWPQQPQGLDKAAIQALPIVSSSSTSSSSSVCALAAGSNKECCVCLGEFQESDRLRLLPKCGHTFHIDCIDMWLFSHTTCPLCRFRLTPDNVVADSASVALELLLQQQQQLQRDHQRLHHHHHEEPISELQIHIHEQQQQLQSEISITVANTSDVEEQQAEDHDNIGMNNNTQECGEEMKLPGFLLKVWDLIRCWRLGLGARIGHGIFM